ncbi:HTH-type transcriptional regulator RutR [Paraglaciecola marina]|uniref:HTH-type transcriptional regulator RutR n=1 Tax=Paraglaciecola marina TaxID=2500157 RepID=UPI001EF15D02|nr:HTH-type transcriptional regulator RutR [Paraglaciecola marina]
MSSEKTTANSDTSQALGGGTKRSRAKLDKKNAIMQAALELFSRHGVKGTRVEKIAALAKVSKTNLLYYFNSKEQLYIEVMQRLLQVWLAPLASFNEEQDAIQTINDYIRVKLELSRDHPAESRLFCMEMLHGAPLLEDQLKSPLKELVDSKAAVINAWIAAGKLAPVDPYHLIFTIWSTTQHYADFRVQIESITDKNLDDHDFFESTLSNLQNIILQGVRPS